MSGLQLKICTKNVNNNLTGSKNMETTGITVFKQFEADIKVLEAANIDKTFDLKTSEGLQDCRAWVKKHRKVEIEIDKLRKKTGADLLAQTKALNAEAKEITGRVSTMIAPHRASLKVKDDAIQKEIDDLAAANALKAEIELDERLAYLEYGERKLKAAQDEQKAIEDAAQAVIDKAEAAEKTAATTAFAVEKALHDEKGLRIAEELAEKIKQDEIDLKEAERVSNVKHQTNIHLAIHESILPYTKNAANADMLIAAIVAGRIANLEIVY